MYLDKKMEVGDNKTITMILQKYYVEAMIQEKAQILNINVLTKQQLKMDMEIIQQVQDT